MTSNTSTLKRATNSINKTQRTMRNFYGSDISRRFPLPNLIEVQKDSYDKFLFKDEDRGSSGLTASLKAAFPVADSGENCIVEFLNYRLEKPKFDVAECRKKSLTYSAPLYISIRLVVFSVDDDTGVKEVQTIKDQDVYLCSVPLMTDNATFIINGVERVMVSQIHRSPGVFFVREFEGNAAIYSSRIIPYRGSWLDLEFDAKGSLGFRIDKKKKLPIAILLLAMGFSSRETLDTFYESLTCKRSGNAWQVHVNLELARGKRIVFNLKDKSGNVVYAKNTFVTRKLIKDQKDSGLFDFYVDAEDLIDSVLFSEAKIENETLFSEGVVLTESILGQIDSAKIQEIKIIDANHKDYNSYIINSLLLHSGSNEVDAFREVFKVLRPSDPFSVEDAREYFNNLFFNSVYYDLSTVGRYKINSYLHIDQSEKSAELRKEDIVLTIKELIRLKDNNLVTDDIDHLGNRRVRSVGELIENQFRIGLNKMTKSMSERLNMIDLSTVLPSDLIISSPVTTAIKDFFMTGQLSQFMEQTNPIAELAHKRRISALGPGGLSRDRATFEVRDVHPTHYGRICPIETPEGSNIGLISSLATYSVINKYGFIESPYRKVEDSKVTDKIEYLDANQEYKYTICQFDSAIMEKDKIMADLVSARRGGEFVMSSNEEINFIDLSPSQIISVVASLIPFLESDDASRALMGSNMQRQAVPLLITQAPLVGTGMESAVTKDSGAVVVAKRDGIVSMVESDKIVVNATDDEDEEDLVGVDIYNLRKFDRSNQSTCINQTPIVSSGMVVKKGDIIADGPSTKNGELALGKNLLVAFMPWNGYNFEDSILISERVAAKDVFTSIHIEEFEVVARDTRLGAEEITRDLPSVPEEQLHYLDETGIVHVGVFVHPGDILVGKVTPKSEAPITPEEKLLRAIFGEKVAEVRDSSLRVPIGVSGVVTDVKILTRRGIEKDPRAKEIESAELLSLKESHEYQMLATNSFFEKKLNSIILGSEVLSTPKHKKAISKMEESHLNELSFSDKLNVVCADVAKNKGIIAIKKEYEEFSAALDFDYRANIKKIIDGDDLQQGVLKIVKVSVAIKNRLQPGDKMAGRHGNKGVVSKVVAVEDMPFLEDGTPVDVVLNPMGVPSRMNIGQVLETHLGLASALMGKQIDKMLQENADSNALKKKILSFLTDKELKSEIESFTSEEVESLAKEYSHGIPFASPVFEGAVIKDIEDALEKVSFSSSGQAILTDGKSGEKFSRPVTVGYIYMMKLHHLVDNKIHARSIGPYSLVTQQPLGGKSHFGGQRLGEMECWALQAYGAAYTLQEMLTVKSDDVEGRRKMYESIVRGESSFDCGIPESFNVMIKELRSLCLNIELETPEGPSLDMLDINIGNSIGNSNEVSFAVNNTTSDVS